MTYDLTSPCGNCPFRRDVRPFLSTERAEQIAHTDGEFACHKTTESTDDGDRRATPKSKHCAGFLIMREKAEAPSQMMRICERLGLYNRHALNMAAPVYDGPDEMIEAYDEVNA